MIVGLSAICFFVMMSPGRDFVYKSSVNIPSLFSGRQKNTKKTKSLQPCCTSVNIQFPILGNGERLEKLETEHISNFRLIQDNQFQKCS